MQAVDDSITILVDGMDPKYDDPNLGPNPENWNGTLFETVGDAMDGIGIHRYNWGIRDPEAIADWKEANDADAIDYNEVLLAFPTQFDEPLAETVDAAEEAGLSEFQLAIGEWGLYPTVAPGDPWPDMSTMAGAAYAAGMFNAFIRRSEHVRRASHTYVPVRMFPPESVDHPANPSPLLPFGFTQSLYANVFDDDQTWTVAETSVAGETMDIPETGDRIREMEDVPYVDAATVETRDRNSLCTFLTNRNLREGAEIAIEIPERFTDADVTVTVQRPTDSPHAQQQASVTFPARGTTGLDVYAIDDFEASIDDGVLGVDLEASAVARVSVERPGCD